MALAALPQARAPDRARADGRPVLRPGEARCQGHRADEADGAGFQRHAARLGAGVRPATSYGKRDTETVVRAPILAEASMPRVLAPGRPQHGHAGRAELHRQAGRVQGAGRWHRPAVDRRRQRARASSAPKARRTLSFPLHRARGLHAPRRCACAWTATAIKVDRRYDLPVRPAWPQVLRARTRVLDALAPVTLDAGLADGLMPDSVNARMVVSALPPIPFASALRGRAEVSVWLRRADHQQGLRRADAG